MAKFTGRIYVFANKYERKNGGTFTRCTTNIPETDKDGNVLSRFYLDVLFRGDKAPTEEQVNKLKDDYIYEMDVKDGFLRARSYQKGDGTKHTTLVLIVQEVEIVDKKKTDSKTEAGTSKKKAKSDASKKNEGSDTALYIKEDDLPF